MKTLVVYFSLTGNTKVVAEKIAKKLNADIDSIIDTAKVGDKGVMKEVNIDFKKDPSKYDLVVIGSPVWAFGIPPFTKKYLQNNKFGKVAFFCTFSLNSCLLFSKMKKFSKKPIAVLKIKSGQINNSDKEIELFCKKLAN